MHLPARTRCDIVVLTRSPLLMDVRMSDLARIIGNLTPTAREAIYPGPSGKPECAQGGTVIISKLLELELVESIGERLRFHKGWITSLSPLGIEVRGELEAQQRLPPKSFTSTMKQALETMADETSVNYQCYYCYSPKGWRYRTFRHLNSLGLAEETSCGPLCKYKNHRHWKITALGLETVQSSVTSDDSA